MQFVGCGPSFFLFLLEGKGEGYPPTPIISNIVFEREEKQPNNNGNNEEALDD